jgi:tRNA(His) 5'-end guanylyltransferase
MESISASLATGIFNQLRYKKTIYKDSGFESDNFGNSRCYKFSSCDLDIPIANFDSRSFNIPREDTANYFYARQKDAVKNSIAMLTQSLYSHKELHGKNGSDMQEMCFQKGHNYNDLHWSKKRGSFIIKNQYCDGQDMSKEFLSHSDSVIRSKWEVVETPMKFSDEVFKQWL